jgi:hypothetical protein
LMSCRTRRSEICSLAAAWVVVRSFMLQFLANLVTSIVLMILIYGSRNHLSTEIVRKKEVFCVNHLTPPNAHILTHDRILTTMKMWPGLLFKEEGKG